jgi:hypothetical protein
MPPLKFSEHLERKNLAYCHFVRGVRPTDLEVTSLAFVDIKQRALALAMVLMLAAHGHWLALVFLGFGDLAHPLQNMSPFLKNGSRTPEPLHQNDAHFLFY